MRGEFFFFGWWGSWRGADGLLFEGMRRRGGTRGRGFEEEGSVRFRSLLSWLGAVADRVSLCSA